MKMISKRLKCPNAVLFPLHTDFYCFYCTGLLSTSLQNEPLSMEPVFCSGPRRNKFNDAYSGDDLPKKIKNGTYVINLDEYVDVGTHCIALYVSNNGIFYIDNFGVEPVSKEIRKLIGNKNIKTNVFRIQAGNSIMYGY